MKNYPVLFRKGQLELEVISFVESSEAPPLIRPPSNSPTQSPSLPAPAFCVKKIAKQVTQSLLTTIDYK